MHEQLNNSLSFIANPKYSHRLCFGKDIHKKIHQKSLQILYCSPAIYEKFHKNVPKEYLTSSFKIYKIESLEKGDVGNRLINDFDGAIGVTYY